MNVKRLIRQFRFFVSPLFLSRFSLRQSIHEIVSTYAFSGKVLDFGCGDTPYQHFFRYGSDYRGIDFPRSRRADYSFSKDYLKTFRIPFQNETFDHVVSFHVLEHHQDPEKMFGEVFRVVKAGGYVLLTVPFLYGIHCEPDDYQRFTKYGLIVRAKKYGRVVELRALGSFFSVISTLFGEALVRFTGKSTFHYFVGLLIFTPFLLFSYAAFFLDRFFVSDHFVLHYLILMRKHSPDDRIS